MSSESGAVVNGDIHSSGSYGSGNSGSWPDDVGIIAMELYVPNLFVDQSELELFDGGGQGSSKAKSFVGKYTVGLGQQQMGFVADNEDVNSLALTAVSRLFKRQGFSPRDFGRLEVGTESILDRSKSVKTVLMQLFEQGEGEGEGHTDLEGVDSVNACYGATAALFNTAQWVESSSWDGRLGLVVGADIAVYAQGAARPTGGAGAIAMVVGPHAALVLDRGLRGTEMRHVYDFYKPRLDSEYPEVDGPLSVECYLSALDTCYSRYRTKFNNINRSIKTKTNSTLREEEKVTETRLDLDCFDAILFHTPFCKIVQKSLGRLVLCEYLDKLPHSQRDAKFEPLQTLAAGDSSGGSNCLRGKASYHNKQLERTLVDMSRQLFIEKTEPGLRVARRVGNMYTPSLYSCLVSFLTSGVSSSDLCGKRVAMFSYGSGMAATMYSITVSNKEERVDRLLKGISSVDSILDQRVKCSPEEFVRLLEQREMSHNRAPLDPSQDTSCLQPDTYYLAKVDGKHRRTYLLHTAEG